MMPLSETLSKNQDLKCWRSEGRLRAILSRYQDLRASEDADGIHRNRAVLDRWNNLKEVETKKNYKEGHLFNPLHFFSIGETKHSDLLGFLLKPRESHGLGDVLLKKFLERLGVPYPERGKWQVTVEKGRIDLLLYREFPKSIIIIENKSHHAVDQAHQLYRYWHRVIHQREQIPFVNYETAEIKDAFQLVYLPSNDEKIPEAHSLSCPSEYKKTDPSLPDQIPLDYKLWTFNKDIAEWLEEAKTCVPTSNYRLKAYLEFYQELCLSL